MFKNLNKVDSHQLRSFGVFSLLALLTVFVIAGIVLALKKDDTTKQANTDTVQESITASTPQQLDEEIIASADSVISGTADEIEKSERTLVNIADSETVDSETRKVALNALADQCFFANDLDCLNDLLVKYQAAGLDDTFAREQIRDLESFTQRNATDQ